MKPTNGGAARTAPRTAPRAAPLTSPRDAKRRADLLRWYRRMRRDLPWRRTTDPYAIWISEIMLQQTRVEAVIPFYERFLERFPDVGSLASSDEADVLAAWSGLGYYRRARHLRRAAVAVVRDHDGRLPKSMDGLASLPGIGPYTAAAIASIAFGIPAAAVDGNVIRVIARWEGFRGRRDEPALKRRVTAKAEAFAVGRAPGDWTQALMELGATICLPREPLCERCPVSRSCVAYRGGRPDRFPTSSRPLQQRREKRLVLIIRDRDHLLLIPDAADDGATWAPPSAELRDDESAARIARNLAKAHGAKGEPRGPAHSFRHQTYSRDSRIEVWEAAGHRDSSGPAKARWARQEDLRAMPLRAVTLKAIKGL